MICAAVDLDGTVRAVEPLGDGSCASLVLVSFSEFVGAYSQITSSEILADFGWGFGVVVFFWSLGASIGAAKRVINKL